MIIQVEKICMDEVETGDVLCVPDTQALANRLRCCLQVLAPSAHVDTFSSRLFFAAKCKWSIRENSF